MLRILYGYIVNELKVVQNYNFIKINNYQIQIV